MLFAVLRGAAAVAARGETGRWARGARRAISAAVSAHPGDAGETQPLSFPGGTTAQARRGEMQAILEGDVARTELPSHARMHARDMIWMNQEVLFVGTGAATNYPGLRAFFKGAARGQRRPWQARRLAVVRDIFDRVPERQYLQSVVRCVTDDAVAMLEGVQRAPRNRLVNEYTIDHETGELVLLRHDIDFVKYLKELGLRVVPVKSGTELQSLQPSQITVQQSTNHLLMVAPTAFEQNQHAVADNHFMSAPSEVMEPARLQAQVLREFAGMYQLVAQHAEVHLFTHEKHHDTPDALFPNNWMSTHTNLELSGDRECTLILYPMKAPNRRKERRPEFLRRLLDFRRYTNIIDLTRQEDMANPKFLEGTGSLVLDRVNNIAYMCVSERSNLELARRWARMMEYDLVAFNSVDDKGRPIYHTNVMMSVGSTVALVCADSVPDKVERELLLASLRSSHDVIEISHEQVTAFCGNVLEIENMYGHPALVMSTRAFNAFTDEQRALLCEHMDEILHADLSTIEAVGGGGARCMIAQLF